MTSQEAGNPICTIILSSLEGYVFYFFLSDNLFSHLRLTGGCRAGLVLIEMGEDVKLFLFFLQIIGSIVWRAVPHRRLHGTFAQCGHFLTANTDVHVAGPASTAVKVHISFFCYFHHNINYFCTCLWRDLITHLLFFMQVLLNFFL